MKLSDAKYISKLEKQVGKLEEENEALMRWLDLNAQTERYEAWRAYTQEPA